MSEPLAPTTRRYDLDWLRVIAFALLIFYHIGMFYVTWGWHVKSVHAGPAPEWLMMLLNPWRLSLLFFISGVALRFAIDKAELRSFAGQRLSRLGLPILFGMAVIVAPQAWLELVESGEFTGSFAAFYPQYLDFESDHSVTTPTWNHLWYVVYLLVYSMILVVIGRPISRWMTTGSGKSLTQVLFGRRWGPLAVIVIPVLPFMIYRLFLVPHFPTTHDLTGDWANHAISFTYLLLGYVIAKDEAFWSAIKRVRVGAIMATVLLGAGLAPIWSNWETIMVEGSTAYDFIWPVRFARVLYAWLAIVTLLSLAQMLLNRDGPVLRYMTEAIFPYYILHQTLIVMAGFWLTRQGLSAGVEFALVLVATIGGCALIHEVCIRRWRWIRPLFGLKVEKAEWSTKQPSHAR